MKHCFRRSEWLWGLLLAVTVGCSAFELNQLRGDAYPLDAIDREAAAKSDTPCHPEGLVLYRGKRMRLEPPSRVAEPFAERLESFEETLARIGEEVYGRAPSKILNVGAYVCRPIEAGRTRVSEHALGNAIDVTGFSFPGLPKPGKSSGTSAPIPDLPPQLRAAFTVSVQRDYLPPSPANPLSERHQRFFALLRQTLQKHELFRGVIGPPDPAHRTHFHLDMAPWPYERL